MREQISEKILTDGISKQGYTLYHRTGNSSDPKVCVQTINSILKNGFKPGGGAMYGKGLYTTTDRKSQFNYNMVSSYGAGVLKIVAPAKGILVLDYNIAGILFGTGMGKSGYPAYSLVDQLIRFGIFQNEGKIPLILKALSEDLECTWGAANRKLSAERAYHIFMGCLIEGGSVASAINNLSNLPSEMKDFYHAAKYNPIKNFDKNPKVNGIVFSGNHDGNVLVAYNFSMLKPVMWGVSDANKADDPKAWVIPLQPVKGTASMATIEDMFSDILADEGMISPRGSVASFYYEGMDFNTKDRDVASIKKLAPWMGIRSNGFNSIHVALSKSGESFIYEGSWLQGRYTGYFGADKIVMAYVQKILGKTPTQNFFPEWEMGNFVGKYFAGNFKGGVFEKGTFNGVFSGGVWLYNKDAVWGTSAQFVSGKNSHFINYEGTLYPLDSDPETWVKKRLAVQNTDGGKKNYVDDTIPLFQNLENSFPFKMSKVNTSKYTLKKSLADSFKDLRAKFDWLWSKGIHWSPGSVPEIYFENDKVLLLRGMLNLGGVFFANYSEVVEVAGGVIDGDNEFYGHFRGGIYKKGTFKGNWYGGTWFEKDTKWDGKATLLPGTTVGAKNLPAETTIVVGSKSWKIVPEAYLTWKTIPELIKAIKNGDYQKLLDSLKKSKKPVGTSQFISRVINTAKTVTLSIDDLLAIVNDDDDDEDDDDSLLDSWDNKDSLTRINEYLAEKDFNRKISIVEKQFSYRDLSDDEQEMLYQEFKDSYEKATGAAFSFSAFEWRANNWTFFGTPPDEKGNNTDIGGVAVRKQQSNDMFKLVASFGSFRSVMKGFIELNQKHGRSSIWGMVTPNIQKMLVRGNKDFVSLPGVVVKALEPALKKLSNGEVKSVGLNGIVKVDTPAGVIDKVFVANKVYIKWLLDAVSNPSMASKIPVPQAVLTPLVGMIKALL